MHTRCLNANQMPQACCAPCLQGSAAFMHSYPYMRDVIKQTNGRHKLDCPLCQNVRACPHAAHQLMHTPWRHDVPAWAAEATPPKHARGRPKTPNNSQKKRNTAHWQRQHTEKRGGSYLHNTEFTGLHCPHDAEGEHAAGHRLELHCNRPHL